MGKGDGDLDCPGMDEGQQPGCMVACKAASWLVGERLERPGMLLRCPDTGAVRGHCCGAWTLLQALGKGSATAGLLKHKRLPHKQP